MPSTNTTIDLTQQSNLSSNFLKDIVTEEANDSQSYAIKPSFGEGIAYFDGDINNFFYVILRLRDPNKRFLVLIFDELWAINADNTLSTSSLGIPLKVAAWAMAQNTFYLQKSNEFVKKVMLFINVDWLEKEFGGELKNSELSQLLGADGTLYQSYLVLPAFLVKQLAEFAQAPLQTLTKRFFESTLFFIINSFIKTVSLTQNEEERPVTLNIYYEPLKQYIDAKLSTFSGNVPTIEEAASALNISTTTFKLLFKSIFNKNYGEFFFEVKMTRAVELLQNKQMPIAQIAKKAGFRHSSNFIRAFKNNFGVTPLEYRKMIN
jgi:AraC-like DNA-binding protein